MDASKLTHKGHSKCSYQINRDKLFLSFIDIVQQKLLDAISDALYSEEYRRED